MYLRHFISGVPFDRQKQLRKTLWDVYTVMSAERQVETKKQTWKKIETGTERSRQKDKKVLCGRDTEKQHKTCPFPN